MWWSERQNHAHGHSGTIQVGVGHNPYDLGPTSPGTMIPLWAIVEEFRNLDIFGCFSLGGNTKHFCPPLLERSMRMKLLDSTYSILKETLHITGEVVFFWEEGAYRLKNRRNRGEVACSGKLWWANHQVRTVTY